MTLLPHLKGNKSMNIFKDVQKASNKELTSIAFWINLANQYNENIDLQGADLRQADLRWADLQGADLRRADLRQADLQEADLQGAKLQGADLQGADLRWADLQHTKTLRVLGLLWEITIYPTDLVIGCERHTLKYWDSLSDTTIAKMDSKALNWWKQWKEVILEMCKKVQES